MRITFDEVVQAFRENKVPFREFSDTSGTFYTSCKNLVSSQKSYDPETIYLGDWLSFDPTLPHKGSAFIFWATSQVEPPHDCDFAFTTEQGSPLARKAVQALLYSDRMLLGSDRLFRLLLKGKGLKYLVDVFSDILNNPVIICEPKHMDWVVFPSKYHAVDQDLEQMMNYRALPDAVSTTLSEYEVEHMLLEETHPIILDKGYYASSPRLTQVISNNGKIVAAVTVVQANRAFEEGDSDIVQLLCTLVEEELRATGSPESALYEYELQNLLSGKGNERSSLPNWLGGSDQLRFCRVSVFRSQQLDAYQLESLLRKRYAHKKTVYLTRLKKDVVILSTFSEHKSDEAFLEEIDSYLDSINATCGVSTSFSGIDGVAAYYHTAQQALEAGTLAHPDQHLFIHDRLLVECLLNAVGEQGDLAAYIPRQLVTLLDYDKEFGTDFYHTLKTYLRSNTREATAKALNVHKNTLIYRLDRIASLADIDYHDTELRFRLTLATHIVDYLDILGNAKQD